MLQCERCCPRARNVEGRRSFPTDVWTACAFLPRYWQVFFAGLDAVLVSGLVPDLNWFSAREMFRRYLREKHPPKGYTTDMPEDIFGCWLATWMRCVNDVSTYSSSHSSRHFLGGCCSRWICIWHFCSLSWVGCILSHVVHRYEILWGMWGSRLGDGLSVWVLQESESLHFILSTSHRAFIFRTQKLHCLSVKHKTEVQERKVPDWAVNCGPNLLEGIRSALSFSDGQQFVHLQPIYWVHWCMLQHHTAYILYRIYFEAPHYTEPERPQAERVAIKIGKVSFGDPAWRSAPRRFGDERGGWDQRDSEILALRGITNISDLFSQLVPIICCFLGIVGCIVHIYRSGMIFKLQIKNSKPTVAWG